MRDPDDTIVVDVPIARATPAEQRADTVDIMDPFGDSRTVTELSISDLLPAEPPASPRTTTRRYASPAFAKLVLRIGDES